MTFWSKAWNHSLVGGFNPSKKIWVLSMGRITSHIYIYIYIYCILWKIIQMFETTRDYEPSLTMINHHLSIITPYIFETTNRFKIQDGSSLDRNGTLRIIVLHGKETPRSHACGLHRLHARVQVTSAIAEGIIPRDGKRLHYIWHMVLICAYTYIYIWE